MNPLAAKSCHRLLVPLLFAAGAACAQTDADFLRARAAFDKGDARALDAAAQRLGGHLLEPYVTYWQLKLALDSGTAGPAAAPAWLARWPDVPLAERVRVDGLKAAARRGDWTTFALDYPVATGEDTELACYGVQYRRQRDGDTALAAAKSLWFTGQATPEACEPLFAALIANGGLGVADRRARMRLATEAGNVRLAIALGSQLPAPERIDVHEIAQVEREPLRALEKGAFNWRDPAGRSLALFALERAARRDAAATRAPWVKWRDRLPEADRLYGNGRLAYFAARQHVPAANEWFREAAGAPLAEDQHAWRVRAGLRAQNWRDVLAAVEAMPATQAQEGAWQYWRARALAATGRPEEAQPLFAALAAEFNFYGLLAAETLGRAAPPRSQPAAPSAEALAAFGARADVRRALKLAELDLRPEMLREWAAIVRNQDDTALLTSAEFALRAGLPDRAINAADRTRDRHDFALRYPTPHKDAFEAAGRDQDIDAVLLYAIARQESRFMATIVSSAGAQGLMQLMPATARWVAKQLGRSDYSAARIADVDLNTQFGAYYFRYWLERLDNHPALAAAAYNAGPGRAQAWRPVAPLDGAAWVETIPFNETRDYVKKVLTNAVFYEHALGRAPVKLSTRLATVTPRGANGNAALAVRAE